MLKFKLYRLGSDLKNPYPDKRTLQVLTKSSWDNGDVFLHATGSGLGLVYLVNESMAFHRRSQKMTPSYVECAHQAEHDKRIVKNSDAMRLVIESSQEVELSSLSNIDILRVMDIMANYQNRRCLNDVAVRLSGHKTENLLDAANALFRSDYVSDFSYATGFKLSSRVLR